MIQADLLQKQYLTLLQKQEIQVSVYLINGIKLQGLIDAFDDTSIVLSHHETNQMVYKHSISTIVPTRKVAFSNKG